jgi:predicted outer membrane protein
MTTTEHRRTARQLLADMEAISTESRQLLREVDIGIEDELAISTALYDGLASVRWACAKLAGKDGAETEVQEGTI